MSEGVSEWEGRMEHGDWGLGSIAWGRLVCPEYVHMFAEYTCLTQN